jgi:hypothetical protein
VSFHPLNVGNAVDVSEVYVSSVAGDGVNSMGEYSCMYVRGGP